MQMCPPGYHYIAIVNPDINNNELIIKVAIIVIVA